MARAWAAAAVLVLGPAAPAADPLAARIEAVIDGPDYEHAHWGVLVADANSGGVVYARNADKLFAPASTTKLFTCAAALVAYGPGHTFVTPVYRRGDLAGDGTLRGDLILVASGDPSLGGRTAPDGKLAFRNVDHTYANSGLGDAELTDTSPTAALDALAGRVKAAGIVAVAGEVLIDDRLFAPAQGTGSGPTAVTPIAVNDNVLDVTVTPGAAGGSARVAVRPETAYARFDCDVVTGGRDSAPIVTVGSSGPREYTVRGSVPAGGKPVVRVVAVDDPAAFARTLFAEALRRQGVRVAASPFRPAGGAGPLPDTYDGLERVAAYTSPPFSELTAVTLKVSHNLYASTLPCLLAAKAGKRTLADGMREEQRILRGLGVDVGAISFGGGAGGSNADKVSPRAAVQLLTGMRARPEWAVYKAGLPVLGVDGTLATAVPADSPARGKAFGKTGTLFWPDALNGRSLLASKALAGVMTTATGRELVYGMFVNDVPLPAGVAPAREGKVLGRLCEIIYEYAD